MRLRHRYRVASCRRGGVSAATVVAMILVAVGGGTAWAAFTRTTANPTNSFAVSPDFTAPSLNRSVAGETVTNSPGHIHPGSTYQFYGNVTDTGSPASGVSTVRADLSALTAGQTAATMTAGTFTYNSTSYSNRTGTLTAASSLSSCSYTPTVTSTDAAGNSRTENADKVMVDRDLLSEYYVRIDGAVASDQQGLSVANAGDVNGDGRPDAIVTANQADNNSRTNSGSAWIVFGRSSAGTVDLAALGTGGYRIDGAAANDQAGVAVSGAGDVNGDGRADVIISSSLSDITGTDAGSVYIVFGKTSSTTIDLSSLGSNGYRIDGAAAGDQAGVSVANAGDVNGDSRPDALISAYNADNNSRSNSGSSYIVFGKTSTTTISLASLGSGGYRIDGAVAGDQSGIEVSSAGDVNGDSRPDALIGAYTAGNNGRAASGSAYVVFGKTSTTTIDLASLGSNGYRIDGAVAGDSFGFTLRNAGDVNGDGRVDAMISAYTADNNGRSTSGSAYVIYGKTSTTTIDAASLGTQGYRIDGATANSKLSVSVGNIGDLNGDGIPDALITAYTGDSYGRTGNGAVYVVFGKTGNATIDLATIGTQGYRIDGAANSDAAGRAVSPAGDVNGDGRMDFLITARGTDNNGRTDSGSTYIMAGPSCT